MNKKTLTIQTNFANCAQVLEKIQKLDSLFSKTFKKSPKCELVYSQPGDKYNPIHNLAIWHDGSSEQMREIEFFVKNI